MTRRSIVVRTARIAGGISISTSEGQKGQTYLENVREGDRVRFKEDMTVDSDDGEVTVEREAMGEVMSVSLAAPLITVFVTTAKDGKGGAKKIKRRLVSVPPDALSMILSSEDTRF